jgi:hypothetical protein
MITEIVKRQSIGQSIVTYFITDGVRRFWQQETLMNIKYFVIDARDMKPEGRGRCNIISSGNLIAGHPPSGRKSELELVTVKIFVFGPYDMVYFRYGCMAYAGKVILTCFSL